MMDIFYLTVDRYHQYKPHIPPGIENPGGGISDKTLAVLKAWRRFYQVGVSENVHNYPDAKILVVEPLWFKLRGNLRDPLWAPDMEEAVRAYESYDTAFKICYLSEFSFLKFPKRYRDRIIAASTVVTSNCAYQKAYFAQFGIKTSHLCDPVDDTQLPALALPRTMNVCAVGRISTTKNSQKIADLFQALKAYPIETVYIGDAGLWGDVNALDKSIELQIQQVADRYYPNQTLKTLMQQLNGYACGVFDSFHDSCSASNITALMSGVRCLYGRHGCWRERPGVHGLDTVDDFVEALKSETANFTVIPEGSASWAIKRYGLNAFLEDWSTLLQEIGYVT